MEKGRFKVIRTDGTETLYGEKPTIQAVYKAIGCTCCDTVTLDKTKGTVMFVDDSGMIAYKPVNPKATALMRQAFGEQYPYNIHGDVALVNDADFGINRRINRRELVVGNVPEHEGL
jgi:hypothetical protein